MKSGEPDLFDRDLRGAMVRDDHVHFHRLPRHDDTIVRQRFDLHAVGLRVLNLRVVVGVFDLLALMRVQQCVRCDRDGALLRPG